MPEEAEVTLRVPGDGAYALVIRAALGGVALLKDFDTGAMDDLREAASEACDSLLHQGARARTVEVRVRDEGASLMVSLEAELDGRTADGAPVDAGILRAVLETLIPRVELTVTPEGLVRRVDLTLPKAV